MDQNKRLDGALKEIEKQFGEGTVMRLGDNASMAVEVIPTGSITLTLLGSMNLTSKHLVLWSGSLLEA